MSSRSPLRTVKLTLALSVAALMLSAIASATPAFAAGAWWHLGSINVPSNLHAGEEGQLVLTATNLGYEDAKATPEHPIIVTDHVPAGLSVTEAAGYAEAPGTGGGRAVPPEVGDSVPCTVEASLVKCELKRKLTPYQTFEVLIRANVEGASNGELNQLTVEGGEGGIVSASLSEPITVNTEPTKFGVQQYELRPENEDGTLDTQAGSHPFQLTTVLGLNQMLEANAHAKRNEGTVPKLARDLHFVLPRGLLGNVTVVPKCTAVDFGTIGLSSTNSCPENTAIGAARVTINEPNNFHGVFTQTVPVFNVEPGAGEPARFGLEIDKVPIVLNTRVRTGEDYAVEVSVTNASQAAALLGSEVTFWGAPGDPRHTQARGWCNIGDKRIGEACSTREEEELASTPAPGAAFLSLPTTCESEPKTTVTGDSWTSNGSETPATLSGEATLPAFTGCESLDFSPTIEVEPSTHSASSPTGLAVNVNVPQQSTLDASELAEGTVKSTTVELPPGVHANPAAANGLLACSSSQFGFNGGLEGLPESAQVDNEHFSANGIECPDAAKIGSVRIKTPDLEKDLTGGVYLASQDTNPFGSPLVLYLSAEDPVSGVKVKLAGHVNINQSNGQLVSTFEGTPPVPFESLELDLFEGSTASQSTPSTCGSYTTPAHFLPWSSGSTTDRSATFSITSGPGGGPCPSNPLPFNPSMKASSENQQAGGFSPFTFTIGHPDSDQSLTGVEAHLPLGAAAMLSSVELCKEPPPGQEWNCSANSLIGKATASSGFGPTPFTLPGNVYITTGYDGAPFGLLVSTNAEHAGPFNLGIINVRSRINVDRNTAQVSVTTDPGPRGEALPTILKGVPVDLKQITVTVDRPDFEFNPTDCSPLATTGTLTGAGGAKSAVSAPFAVSNCTSLPFKPKLTASTQGNASKANGASLTIKVESTTGQANIAKTKLVLPITLPSRLTTIQKACLDSVFEANPAGCAEGSNIGSAVVHTPVLREPLEGPAYLVSHGNAAFPDVEFVLTNKEGIELILDGQTDIKKGITTSTFNSVPDAPVSVFEAKLPEGPHSALTSNVAESKHFSLCGAKLTIPTTITGQNGAVIQQETKVPVAGCAAVKGFKVSRSQKLAKALKACRKQFKHSKKKRASCEAKARKKYAAKKKTSKKKSAKKKK